MRLQTLQRHGRSYLVTLWLIFVFIHILCVAVSIFSAVIALSVTSDGYKSFFFPLTKPNMATVQFQLNERDG